MHSQQRMADLDISWIDPHTYLLALLVSDDPRIALAARRDARKRLKGLRRRQPGCTCFGLKTFDALEGERIVSKLRDHELEPDPADPQLAAVVRILDSGETDLHLDRYKDAAYALDVVLDAEVKRLQSGSALVSAFLPPSELPKEVDPKLSHFVPVLLAPDESPISDVLIAFDELSAARAFCECTCRHVDDEAIELFGNPTVEEQLSYLPNLISNVLRNDWQGLVDRALYPEIYVAVRDAADRYAFGIQRRRTPISPLNG